MSLELASLTRHPWADSTGTITPISAATTVAQWIIAAGGQVSTAFQCAAELARDVEKRPHFFNPSTRP